MSDSELNQYALLMEPHAREDNKRTVEEIAKYSNKICVLGMYEPNYTLPEQSEDQEMFFEGKKYRTFAQGYLTMGGGLVIIIEAKEGKYNELLQQVHRLAGEYGLLLEAEGLPLTVNVVPQYNKDLPGYGYLGEILREIRERKAIKPNYITIIVADRWAGGDISREIEKNYRVSFGDDLSPDRLPWDQFLNYIKNIMKYGEEPTNI